jgi:predicted short-subunit dehydrogenase-like oxidoreductase (DUF2520 family)
MADDVAAGADSARFLHVVRGNREYGAAINDAGRKKSGLGRLGFLAGSAQRFRHVVIKARLPAPGFRKLRLRRCAGSGKLEADSAILRGMVRKRVLVQSSVRPTIAVVGAGNLASALAVALHRAGYVIDSVISRDARPSLKHAHYLAKNVMSRTVLVGEATTSADIVWLCVPDAAISGVAQLLASNNDWKGRIVLHSSGALTSDELSSPRRCGAAVASVHPLMTFVKGSKPSLAGVPFAVEGDPKAVRMARRIVRDLGGQAFWIRKQDKVAYHAWGTFASPLLTALLATSERVASAAGVPAGVARKRMLPIIAQTIVNYAAAGAAAGFSGPIVRGDVEVVRRHLQALRAVPEARDVYVALARAAVRYLPGKKPDAMKTLLGKRSVTK